MINWKKWLKAALIRAVRTFAEAMLAYIGTGALVLEDVNWIAALSAGGFGFVSAILLALAGCRKRKINLPKTRTERKRPWKTDTFPARSMSAVSGAGSRW